MGNNYYTIGYYICEFTICQNLIENVEKFISASECICNHEPCINFCHGWTPNGDKPKYIEKFSSKDEYLQMSKEINNLFEHKLFFCDGRFLRKEDAIKFYKKYFNSPKYILVSISTKYENIELLDETFHIQNQVQKELVDEEIGCEIIGYDICSFHSFLCNNLDKEFSSIMFNSYGLLDNNYFEVDKMASKIKGMGEPVEWIPVILHKVKM